MISALGLVVPHQNLQITYSIKESFVWAILLLLININIVMQADAMDAGDKSTA